MRESGTNGTSGSTLYHRARGANELTEWDRALLQRYLRFYEALDSGERKAATERQRRFVAVCRGRARPRSQHEIAYSRYRTRRRQSPPLVEMIAPADPMLHVTGGSAPSAVPSATQADIARDSIFQLKVEAINKIDELIEWLPSRSSVVSTISDLRSKLESATSWAGERIWSSAPLVTAIINDPELARSIERWSAENFNTLSTIYTKAIDGSYADGLRAGADYVSPLLHRLFERHSGAEAWDAVCDALPTDSFSEEFVGCLYAMGSDFASVTGLPLTTMSPEGFAQFSEFLQSAGLSQNWIIDALHANAAELLGAALPGLYAVLSFSRADREQFGRIVGSLGLAAIIAANPLGGLAALVMTALAYRRAMQAGTNRSFLSTFLPAFGKGFATSGLVVSVSSIVGGPAIVGILVAISASIVVRYGAKGPAVELGRFVVETTRNTWISWGKTNIPNATAI